MRENVLFLDFDLVMQSDYDRSHAIPSEEFSGLREAMRRRFGSDIYLTIGDDDIAAVFYDWLPQTVQLLKHVVETCDAGIVVSSSWRFYDGDEQLRGLLALHGLDGRFRGAISREMGQQREEAILEWVAAHEREVLRWAVADDFDLKGLGDHFVRIRGGRLSKKDAQRLIVVLGGK